MGFVCGEWIAIENEKTAFGPVSRHSYRMHRPYFSVADTGGRAGRCRRMALLRHSDGRSECPVLAEDQKWSADG
jgi:hypothetical protein